MSNHNVAVKAKTAILKHYYEIKERSFIFWSINIVIFAECISGISFPLKGFGCVISAALTDYNRYIFED